MATLLRCTCPFWLHWPRRCASLGCTDTRLPFLASVAASRSLRTDIASRIAATQAKFPRFAPHLAIIQQGARSDSSTYVKMKLKAAAEAGIKCTLVVLGGKEDGVGEDEVMAEVERLNNDPAVHGVLVQLPLSDDIGRDGERRITEAVSPTKDVDGSVYPRFFGDCRYRSRIADAFASAVSTPTTSDSSRRVPPPRSSLPALPPESCFSSSRPASTSPASTPSFSAAATLSAAPSARFSAARTRP